MRDVPSDLSDIEADMEVKRRPLQLLWRENWAYEGGIQTVSNRQLPLNEKADLVR